MYYDAHQHLHDVRLAPFREAILTGLPARGIAGGVVNGTRESDWPAVAALCAEHGAMRPSFGLHPWYVAERTENWGAALTAIMRR